MKSLSSHTLAQLAHNAGLIAPAISTPRPDCLTATWLGGAVQVVMPRGCGRVPRVLATLDLKLSPTTGSGVRDMAQFATRLADFRDSVETYFRA